MAEAAPLSLRDRIRQLEQAAHSPLTDPSASSTRHSSNRPTSSRRLHNGTAAHTSLTVQQVAHADDPLQQQSSEASRTSSASSPSVRTSARSAALPPPKPPRPIWVTSKARETPNSAPLSIDTNSAAETGRGDRDGPTGGGDPLSATLARSPDAAPGGEHSSPQTTQSSLKTDTESTSPAGSISPITRNRPVLPARPPTATVTTPIPSDPPPPSSISHPSSDSARVDSPGTGTPAAPALPPRPAWARKASPSGPLPLDGSRDSTPATSSHLGPRDSSLRDTASSVGSTGTSLATFPSAGPLSGSSSPALPPRPRRVPSPAQQNTDITSSAVVAPNARRRRYDRLFSQCVEAAATARPSLGSEERLDGAVIGELWRRSRLDDAVLRRIWNEVASPEQRSSLDRDEFARGMGMIDDELRRRQR